MKRATLAAGCAAIALAAGSAQPAHAGVEPFIGELQLMGFNFCPRGFLAANGQLISISQNTALFSLLGTTYGGNGQTTFGLPDLRGRAPIHQGQGPGLTPRSLGESSGTETTTLTVTNLPAHNHTAAIFADKDTIADKADPAGSWFGRATTGKIYTKAPASLDDALGAGTVVVGNTGNSIPFSQMQPYLVMNWCIATEGIFPSRN